MKIVKDTELDVVEIIFKEADRVFGREEASGVVVFRDVATNEVCSIEILSFSEYPNLWHKSLEILRLGHLKPLLKEV